MTLRARRQPRPEVRWCDAVGRDQRLAADARAASVMSGLLRPLEYCGEGSAFDRAGHGRVEGGESSNRIAHPLEIQSAAVLDTAPRRSCGIEVRINDCTVAEAASAAAAAVNGRPLCE